MSAASDNAATVNLLTSITLAQVTAWVAAGMPPQFSIDGESYNYPEMFKALQEMVEKGAMLQQTLEGPFALTDRVRC